MLFFLSGYCLILRELSTSYNYILQKILQYIGVFLQGDRCQDLSVNQDLADTDARVSKDIPTSLLFIYGSRSPVLGEANVSLMFI
jgi:hypothetical protein